MSKHIARENRLRVRRKQTTLRNRLRLAFGWFGLATPIFAGIVLYIFWFNSGFLTQAVIWPGIIASIVNVVLGLLLLNSLKHGDENLL